MRKIIATAVAAVAALVVAAPASAAPYARVSETTAANGGHAYARQMDGFQKSYVTTVDCLSLRPALALCAVDTWTAVKGPDVHEGHALVGVLRKGGHYVFRTYELTEIESTGSEA